jgi:hypothetical protein
MSFSLAIVAAAIISGAAVLFTSPEGRSSLVKLQSWWTAPKAEMRSPAVIPQSFAQLNVIDDTRRFFSVDEQTALFAGLSDLSRDPVSMQVRNLRRTAGNRYGVCGEVNSKNGFGGYVGFTPFAGALIGDTAQIELYSLSTTEPLSEWAKKEWAEKLKTILAKLGC